MEYSAEIRQAVVRKALRREMSQEAIAKEFGVSRTSVQNWMRQSRVSGESSVAKVEKRPQDWTTQERFAALMETQGLSEEELGAWCRRHGLHTHKLEQWRRDAMTGSVVNQRAEEQAQLRRLRQEKRLSASGSEICWSRRHTGTIYCD